jgi:hypothetical protein
MAGSRRDLGTRFVILRLEADWYPLFSHVFANRQKNIYSSPLHHSHHNIRKLDHDFTSTVVVPSAMSLDTGMEYRHNKSTIA